MRKSTIGLCLALPVAALAFACSSSDDNSTTATGGSGGSSSGGAAHGGSAGAAHGGSAGSGNAGTGGGGTSSSAGSSSAGATAGGNAGEGGTGEAGAGEAGAGGAGEAGAGNLPTPPANAVYTLSNSATGNAVFGFTRAADGTLTPMSAAFPALGLGSGAALGSQSALVYDKDKDRLYAVNAGDNSFSIFPVNTDGSLGTAVNVSTTGIASGTLLGPKSITYSGNTVYVLFEGSATVASKIAGWTISESGGTLSATAIAGSVLPLSSATKGVDPAEIAFSPNGNWLIVTEKQTGDGGTVTGSGSIDTFSVGATGLATNAKYNATAALPGVATLQSVPYGFAFQGSTLIISEAGSNGVGAYSYTSGVVAPIVAIPQFLATGPDATQVAPCWVAVTGSTAFVSNAKGPNISGFSVGTGGALAKLLSPVDGSVVASTGTATAGPSDESISADGKFLYVLNSGVPSLGIFAIASSGLLSQVGIGDYAPATTKLPAGSVGLVSR
jgi:6-phosphogluconolactonase